MNPENGEKSAVLGLDRGCGLRRQPFLGQLALLELAIPAGVPCSIPDRMNRIDKIRCEILQIMSIPSKPTDSGDRRLKLRTSHFG